MDVLSLIYQRHNVKVHIDKSGIDKIILDDEIITFKWDIFKEYLINPYVNLKSSLQDTPYVNDNLISHLSVTSLDIETNFIRGVSVVLVIQKLIAKEKYLRISSLPEDYSIFTRNNLKALKVAVILHLRTVGDDRMLKHALDFINRWSCLFYEGDEVDKLDLLTELIVKYLVNNSEREVVKPDIDSELLTRIRRIESILGINSN